ncbi:MAG: PTS transporter subunit IIC, partial [Cutibacterium avidum]|nr:PTS transporter subunit IIC [Cutibacterium avidum]
MSIIKGILDIGAVVILPIVMLILCLIFRMPFGKSLKAGLMIGIG